MIKQAPARDRQNRHPQEKTTRSLHIKRLMTICLLLCIANNSAVAQDRAPFGAKFGQTHAEALSALSTNANARVVSSLTTPTVITVASTLGDAVIGVEYKFIEGRLRHVVGNTLLLPNYQDVSFGAKIEPIIAAARDARSIFERAGYTLIGQGPLPREPLFDRDECYRREETLLLINYGSVPTVRVSGGPMYDNWSRYQGQASHMRLSWYSRSGIELRQAVQSKLKSGNAYDVSFAASESCIAAMVAVTK